LRIVGVPEDDGVDELTEPWIASTGEGEGERLETLSAGLRGLGEPPLAVFVKGAPRRGEFGAGKEETPISPVPCLGGGLGAPRDPGLEVAFRVEGRTSGEGDVLIKTGA